jgi:membrane protein
MCVPLIPITRHIVLQILKNAFKSFGKDECGTRAAALAYYTIFALPPLLILIVTIAGRIWGADQVQHAIEGQFSGMVGPDAASQIHDMVAHGQRSAGHGMLGTILGIVGLLLGATGAFLALQDALNHAWEVKPDPKNGGIKNFIMKRLLSLGMVLGLGFLVAVSLALSAGVTAFAGMLGGAAAIGFIADLVVSLVVLTLLFAALFKFLPDGKVEWKAVWVGGLATAVLFVLGKFAIGLYLGHSKPGDSFGAASAFAVLIVWIYYAGMIVLFGAEFTQAWAKAHGHQIVPREGAVRVVQQEQEIRGTTVGAPPAYASTPAKHAKAGPSAKDWLMGLPVLYWLIRSRNSRDRSVSSR